VVRDWRAIILYSGGNVKGAWSWLFLALSVLLNAAASLLLKTSTAVEGSSRLLSVGASLACYGLAFLSYFMCLRRLQVSIAYPIITAGATLVIAFSSAMFLGESLTASKALGSCLVIVGAALLLR
jgi:multidrug transporter EmrE-like cation transporter